MAQVIQVVKCVSCQAFQCQIAKKSTNKWTCKLCKTKQSLKQVYFEGSGKDCRTALQHLRSKEQHLEEQKVREIEEILDYEEKHGISSNLNRENIKFDEQERSESAGTTYQTVALPKVSKWEKYRDEDEPNQF